MVLGHDRRIALRTYGNNRYRRFNQLFDAVHVGLRLKWKPVELTDILGGLHPIVQLDEFRPLILQPARIALPIMGQISLLSMGMVAHPNLDLWQGVENIKLGQGDFSEAI